MPELLIGADPEVFVKDETGKFISAWGLIQGNKKEPKKVLLGAIQVDGNALEFNIDPAKTAEEFTKNIATVLRQLKEAVPGKKLIATPSIRFDDEYWKKLPDEAKVIGCDPDWNVYSEQANVIDVAAAKTPIRCAGGHIHLGWTKDEDINDPVHQDDCFKVGKQLDWYLGVPSSIWDRDTVRRQNYGRAGNIRIKPYGLEYRVLSNMWLSSKENQAWVFNAAKKAFDDLFEGKYAGKIMKNTYRYSVEDMQDSIRNAYNNEAVKWTLNSLGLEEPPKIMAKTETKAA